MQIAVVGASEPSGQALVMAEQVGRELANRGIILVTGGLGGIMEAVCRGAKKEGGTTIGILPGSDQKESNPYVDISICTGIGYARNSIVVKSGSAVIAIDGAFGTLSEIAHALSDGIPVIGLNTWTISRRGEVDNSIYVALDPVEAVDMAIKTGLANQ
jgi:uncharacterized protein (TIGR00725 family)